MTQLTNLADVESRGNPPHVQIPFGPQKLPSVSPQHSIEYKGLLMAKISSKETSPTTRSPKDIRIFTLTADKQPGAELVACTAFADGGADQSVIFEDMLHRFGLEIDRSEKPILTGLGLCQGVRALGKVQLRFRLEERGEYYTGSFLVLPRQMDFDVLLGWPFLSQELGMGYQTPRRMKYEKFRAATRLNSVRAQSWAR